MKVMLAAIAAVVLLAGCGPDVTFEERCHERGGLYQWQGRAASLCYKDGRVIGVEYEGFEK